MRRRRPRRTRAIVARSPVIANANAANGSVRLVARQRKGAEKEDSCIKSARRARHSKEGQSETGASGRRQEEMLEAGEHHEGRQASKKAGRQEDQQDDGQEDEDREDENQEDENQEDESDQDDGDEDESDQEDILPLGESRQDEDEQDESKPMRGSRQLQSEA